VPLLGDGLFHLLKQGNSWHDEMWERYGNTYYASFLFKKHLFVCKYEDVKALLGSEHDLVEGALDTRAHHLQRFISMCTAHHQPWDSRPSANFPARAELKRS
jgi:hypothetical protein